MDRFNKDDIQTLMENENELCISGYMPMFRTGNEIQQNPIRFKNLIQEAEQACEKKELTPQEINSLFKPAYDLLERGDFWRKRSDGLAMYVSPDIFKVYRIPLEFDELVHVGKRFHLKPIIPHIIDNNRFYILAVSQNNVRFLRCDRNHAEELEPEALPEGLQETLKYDMPRKQLQYHSTDRTYGGDNPAVFHGQGVGKDDETQNLNRFCQDIDNGIMELIGMDNAPLVFAGVEYLFPIYRETNSYSNLVPEGVYGNTDEMKAENLHEKAYEVVKPLFGKSKEEAKQKYFNMINSEKTSKDLETIVPAAYYGRVENLFVAKGVQQWGNFDIDNNRVEIHGEKQNTDTDLLDFSAVYTFLNSGAIFIDSRENIPEKGLIAATFRY